MLPMLRIFDMVWVLLSLFCSSALPLQLDTHTTLLINSSHSVDSFEFVISATGSPNSQFQLFSSALSPVYGTHNLTMNEKSFNIFPQLSQETVLFNSFHHDKYWLAFTHPLQNQQQAKCHFLPIQVKKQGVTHELLLPGMDLPLSFLPENSFYRCEDLLFSVQKHQNQVELTVFSKVESEQVWSIQGEWDQKWRHINGGINYGKAIRNNGDLDITIIIHEGNSCTINEQTLEEKSEDRLKVEKYFTFDEVWRWAKEIKSEERQRLQQL